MRWAASILADEQIDDQTDNREKQGGDEKEKRVLPASAVTACVTIYPDTHGYMTYKQKEPEH